MKKKLFILILLSITSICFTACASRGPKAKGRALVEFKWSLHTETKTNMGWVIAYGWVINRGDKRAEWVRVNVYTRDDKTGIVVDKKMTYINGSGPNGKGLEPGEMARFEVRLDNKQSSIYDYSADLEWSDAL